MELYEPVIKEIDGTEAELVYNFEWSGSFQWISHDDIAIANATDAEIEAMIDAELEG